MPFIVGEGDPAWDNQPEDEDFQFKASDFQYVESIAYLPRPPGPITYSLDPPAPVKPLRPASLVVATQAAAKVAAPSLLDRLLGRTPPVAAPVAPPAAPEPVDWSAQLENEQARADADGRRFFSAITPAMRAAGIKAARCRYDGGNDEGFSYFQHYVLATGEELPPEAASARLAASDIGERLRALYPDRQNVSITAADLGEEIALEGAVMINGSGYGNGPFLMFGAFTVDFDACTITDDPEAKPDPEFYGVQG